MTARRHIPDLSQPDPDASMTDVMLGPGGKLIVPQSESAVLGRIMRLVASGNAMAAIAALRALQDQVMHGYHRNNPAQLVVYGNPPLLISRKYGDLRGPIRLSGAISGEVHAILYKHIEDGKPYRHDFEHPTSMLAVERAGRKDVLITSPEGDPIWQDF